MISRQPSLHVGLRILAAGVIVLWLQATSHCAIERLSGDDHHPAEAGAAETLAHHDGGQAQAAEAAEHPHSEASRSNDSGPPAHPHDGGGDACCSTLMATVQIVTPVVIVKPALEPLNFLGAVLQPRGPRLAVFGDKAERQAKDRDGIFTPAVCLDPAHHSLAPPALA